MSPQQFDFNGVRCLVTGATGFIGAHLCPLLDASGASVVGTCHTPKAALPPGIGQLDTLELDQESSVAAYINKIRPDVVFHLASHVTASRDPSLIARMFRINLASTVHLMDACVAAGTRRFVIAGSVEEPNAGERASSPYAASKGACRYYAEVYNDHTNLEVAQVKIAMGYGPRQRDPGKLVPYVIRSLLQGEAPELTSGDRRADWIHGADIAEGLATIGEQPVKTNEPLTLGTGVQHSVREVVEKLVAISGVDFEPRFGGRADRVNETMRPSDIASMQSLYEWSPRYDLDSGLRDAWDWFSARQDEYTDSAH